MLSNLCETSAKKTKTKAVGEQDSKFKNSKLDSKLTITIATEAAL